MGLTRSTSNAILAALAERGYTQRDPLTKTYTLGSAGTALAKAATLADPVLRRTLVEFERLDDTLGSSCSLTERIGDELLVLDQLGEPADFLGASIGDRLPFAPPFGTAIAAWLDGTEADRWLSRMVPWANPEDRPRWRRRLAGIRKTGYAVSQIGTKGGLRILQLLRSCHSCSLLSRTLAVRSETSFPC